MNQDVWDIHEEDLDEMPVAGHDHNDDIIPMNNDGGLLLDMHSQKKTHRLDRQRALDNIILSTRSSRTALPPPHEPEHIADRLFLVVRGIHMGMPSIEVLRLEATTIFSSPADPTEQPPLLQSVALMEGGEVPSSPGCATVGSRLLIIGGLRHGVRSRLVYVLDTEADNPEFTLSAQTNTAKASPSVCQVGGDLYVLNGFAHVTDRWKCDFERYNSNSNTWGALPRLKFLKWKVREDEAYTPPAVLVFGSRIFVSQLEILDVTCFNTSTNSWEDCDRSSNIHKFMNPGVESLLPFCTPKNGIASCTVHLHPQLAGHGLFVGIEQDGFLYLYRVANWRIIKIRKCFQVLDRFDEDDMNCYFTKFGNNRFVFVADTVEEEGFTLVVSFSCEVIEPYSSIRVRRINTWRYGRDRFSGCFANGEQEYQVLGSLAI